MEIKSTYPVVSILTPVYGVEGYVERCVRSLMEQSYEACRYIFVDDHSTDRSLEIIRDTIAEYPHRQEHVQIISHTENRGVGECRNRLIQSAQGDFIIWVDGDDEVDTLLVESMVTRAIISGADALRCGYMELFEDGTTRVEIHSWLKSREETLRAVLGQSHLITNHLHGVMVSLDMVRRCGIHFAADVDMGEDYPFVVQTLYHASKIEVLPTPLYMYRHRKGSYTSHHTRPNIESYVRANLWVTRFILSQSGGESMRHDLALGKLNIKKWLSRRGESPQGYDAEIFAHGAEEWLLTPTLRLYNFIINKNNILLTRLVALIVTLPLYLRVKMSKNVMKKSIKRDKLWG